MMGVALIVKWKWSKIYYGSPPSNNPMTELQNVVVLISILLNISSINLDPIFTKTYCAVCGSIYNENIQ